MSTPHHNPDLQAHWEYFIALDEDLWTLRRYIAFEEANLGTYSIECHRIIQMAALETEAVLYQICKLQNGSCESSPGRTKSFVKLLEHLRSFLNERELELGEIMVEYIGASPVQPFSFEPQSKELSWWGAYTSLKHRRHESLQKATLSHALQATGALVTAISALALLQEKTSRRVNLYPSPKTTHKIRCGEKLIAYTAHVIGPPYAVWYLKIEEEL
jgi:hypothetical protein